MFEKEALIYATVSLPDGYTKIDYQKKTDWQKGAEFGYNKAKEEVQKLNKELGKLEGKLADLTSEYYELENLKNNEIAELKEKCRGYENGYAYEKMYELRVQAENKLDKAIEIITNLVKFDGSYKDDEEYQRKSELYDEIWEQAEQFLKE